MKLGFWNIRGDHVSYSLVCIEKYWKVKHLLKLPILPITNYFWLEVSGNYQVGILNYTSFKLTF